jgi:hypothetical protein
MGNTWQLSYKSLNSKVVSLLETKNTKKKS